MTTFKELETSYNNSSPVELYKITDFRLRNYYFTSSDKSIVFEGNIYVPCFIERSEIYSTAVIERTDIEIKLLKNNPLYELMFNTIYPKISLFIEIYRTQLSDLTKFVKIFTGTLNSPFLNGKEITVTAQTINSVIRNEPLRYNTQYKCNNSQYGKYCKLDITYFSKNVKVTNIKNDDTRIEFEFATEEDELDYEKDLYKTGLSYTKQINSTEQINNIKKDGILSNNNDFFRILIFEQKYSKYIKDNNNAIFQKTFVSNYSNFIYNICLIKTSDLKYKINILEYNKKTKNLLRMTESKDSILDYTEFYDLESTSGKGMIFDIFENNLYIILSSGENLIFFDKIKYTFFAKKIYVTNELDFANSIAYSNSVDYNLYNLKELSQNVDFSNNGIERRLKCRITNFLKYDSEFIFGFVGGKNEIIISKDFYSENFYDSYLSSGYIYTQKKYTNIYCKYTNNFITNPNEVKNYSVLYSKKININNNNYVFLNYAKFNNTYNYKSGELYLVCFDTLNYSLNDASVFYTIANTIIPNHKILNYYIDDDKNLYKFIYDEINLQLKIYKEDINNNVVIYTSLISENNFLEYNYLNNIEFNTKNMFLNKNIFTDGKNIYSLDDENLLIDIMYEVKNLQNNSIDLQNQYFTLAIDDYYKNINVIKLAFDFDSSNNIKNITTAFEFLKSSYEDGLGAQGLYDTYNPDNDFRQITSNDFYFDENLQKNIYYFEIDIKFDDLKVGDSLYIAKGCQNNANICKNKLNNYENYSGFVYIPNKNPHKTSIV